MGIMLWPQLPHISYFEDMYVKCGERTEDKLVETAFAYLKKVSGMLREEGRLDKL